MQGMPSNDASVPSNDASVPSNDACNLVMMQGVPSNSNDARCT